MATTSITKDFYAKDQAAFELLKKQTERKGGSSRKVEPSPSLEKGRKKLATFVFR